MPKLLREFLQHQQEPFGIDVYPLKRAHHHKGIAKLWSIFGGKEKPDETWVQNCSSFLINPVLSQIVSPKRLNSAVNGSQNCTRGEENEDGYKFSSPSSTSDNAGIVYYSVDADRILKRRSELEDNKQLSPISVLQEAESDEGAPSPIGNEEQFSLMMQGKSFLTSTCHQMLKRPACCVAEGRQKQFPDCHRQYIRNEKAVRQFRQLLIDCMREVIEKQRKRHSITINELWRSVCENVWIWSQDYIDETNTIHLVHFEFLASGEDWSSCSNKQQRNGIFMEIGDNIFDDIINEIVQAFM